MSVPTRHSPAAERLLEEARTGNGTAFWQLADGYRPYLKAVAVKLLAGPLPSDGSDTVGKALLQAWQRLDQFRGDNPAAFLGWLAAIVKNEARKALRQAGRLRPLPADSSGEECLASDRAGPDSCAVRREQAARVRGALERLPEDYRRVIELRQFEQLPFAQVGALMGRSSDAVRQLWTRALICLKEELGGLS
jgi:RNA polymerase sigma-70 factor (ECF subfamily)